MDKACNYWLAMEGYGVAIKLWSIKDCIVPADLVIAEFWLLYILTIHESSAVGEGLLASSLESIGSRKRKQVVRQLTTVAYQRLSLVAV